MKNKKMFLGVLAFYPITLAVIIILTLKKYPEFIFNNQLLSNTIILVLISFWIPAIVYYVNVSKSNFSNNKKILWGLSFITIGFITMPIYGNFKLSGKQI